MIELMQLLYNYTLETEFRTQLHTDSYRIKKLNTDQLNRQLHHTLPENLQPLLESYQDALSSQQSTELEAMFLAALSLTRRLA